MKIKLTLYRSEVVPVYTTSLNNKVVDGRELHTFLGIGKVYGAWVKDIIKKHGFIENQDYIIVTPDEILLEGLLSKNGKQKKPAHNRIEYIFQLNSSKKIAMGTNNVQGDQVKDYFLECEKVAKAAITTIVPMAPLGEHCKREVQINNIKAANSKLWDSSGLPGIVEYNRAVAKEFTGLYPSILIEDAKSKGVPAKYRTSGREVMRYMYPSAACAASVCDELVNKGKAFLEVKPVLNKLKDVFDDLLLLGLQPAELKA